MSRPDGSVELGGGAVAAVSARPLSQSAEIFIMFPAPNCDERMYEAQKKFLEEQGHRVCFEGVVEGVGLEDFVSRIMKKYPERVNLVGASVGAHIALECWAIAPERVKSMTLISMKTEPPSAEKQDKRRRIVADLTDPEVKNMRLVEIADKVSQTNFSEYAEHPEGLKTLYMDMAKKMGPGAFATQAGYMVQVGEEGVFARANRSVLSDARARKAVDGSVHEVDTKVIIVVGRDNRRFAVSGDDRVDIEAVAADVARDSTSNLGLPVSYVMIDRAGHMPTFEKPDAVNKALGGMLENLKSRDVGGRN